MFVVSDCSHKRRKLNRSDAKRETRIQNTKAGSDWEVYGEEEKKEAAERTYLKWKPRVENWEWERREIGEWKMRWDLKRIANQFFSYWWWEVTQNCQIATALISPQLKNPPKGNVINYLVSPSATCVCRCDWKSNFTRISKMPPCSLSPKLFCPLMCKLLCGMYIF